MRLLSVSLVFAGSANTPCADYSPSFSEATHKVTFTRDQINAAIGHALKLLRDGRQVGETKYPHSYPRAFKMYPPAQPDQPGTKQSPKPCHAQAPIFEFPILLDGSIYNGSQSPGPDRVVFGSVSTDYASADYVGIAGLGPDGLRSTPYVPHIFHDTSVNRRASADEHLKGPPAHETEHEGPDAMPPLTPPEGRELLTEGDVKVPFLD